MRKVEEIPKVYEELANYRFPEVELTKAEAAKMYEAGRTLRVEKGEKQEDSRYFLRLAVEHAPKSETRKGYDTTGITKQFLVNALNEVMGIDGWTVEARYSPVTPGWGERPESSILCELTLALRFADASTPPDGICMVSRTAHGGHSDYHGDVGNSHKGAHTVAFKRACAEFGLGREAFEGALDPDFMALPSARRQRETKGQDRETKKAAPETPPAQPETPPVEAKALAESVRKMLDWLEKKVPAVLDVPGWRDAFADYCFVVGNVDITTAEDSEALQKVLGDAGRALKAISKKPAAVADMLKSAMVQRHGAV